VNHLVNHPFLTGLAAAAALGAAVQLLPAGALDPTHARAVGLVVFGGLFAALGYFGLDRDDVFWVFVGGVAGCLLTFAAFL
jgi:hypothetical protein